MDTLTAPTWVALADKANELHRQAGLLGKQANEARCPSELGGIYRCCLDAGHDGDHRLDQGAWVDPRAERSEL